jgi:hypothetical protein
MDAFFGNGALHHHHQKGKYNGERRENQESVEICQSRSLLFLQILQGLPGHLLRRSRVSGLLQEPGLCLCDIVHTLLEAPEGGGPEDLPLPRQWPPLLRRWIF